MPACGAYPYSTALWQVLVDKFDQITDRWLLSELILDDLYKIKSDFDKGMNPFICRERYRQWAKSIRESVGAIDLPDWETYSEVCDDPSSMMDQILGDAYGDDWELFFSGEVNPFAGIDRLTLGDLSIDRIIESILESNVKPKFMAISFPELGALYVIASDCVEFRGPCGWKTFAGSHPVEDIADGEDPGPFDTYVLDPETHAEWRKLEEEYDEKAATGFNP